MACYIAIITFSLHLGIDFKIIALNEFKMKAQNKNEGTVNQIPLKKPSSGIFSADQLPSDAVHV